MILVTGKTGFLGRRVCKKLAEYKIEYIGTSLSSGIDLRDPIQTEKLFNDLKPEYVLHCASYVGGLQFGLKYPADMFYNNMLMTVNLFDACKKHSIKRLVNPISNCAYPGDATFFKESEFWDGPLHDSVMVYGMARKMSWVASYAYAKQYNLDTINIILSNMYGPEDHFEEERSHALGALIMKFVDAKLKNSPQVVIWGSGKPVREWLHVDDGAEAMIRAMNIDKYEGPINIGVGKGISVIDMAMLIKEIVGYHGKIVLDKTKEDGAPYKTVDGTLGQNLFGWGPQTRFEDGVRNTIDWYLQNIKQ